MEADVEGLIDAGRHECTRRSGQLSQRVSRAQSRHPVGFAPAEDPEAGGRDSHFPSFLESRKSAEKAPVTVIQEAGIGGVSTGRVDELVQAMVRIPGESPANPR